MALTTPLDSDRAEEIGMIADQITQTVSPQSTAGQQLATIDHLRNLLAQHPDLPAVRWILDPEQPDHVTACIWDDAHIAVDAFHACFDGYASHSEPMIGSDGVPCTSHAWHGDAHGLSFYLYGSDPVDAVTAFTLTHNPDPREWTEQERAEYAALAGQAVAA